MSAGNPDLSGRDERFSAILVACLEARDQGRPPDRRELLECYPEFGEELARFLDDEEHVDRLAAPLRLLAQAITPVPDGTGKTAGETEDLSRYRDVRHVGDYELLEELGRGG